MRRVVWLASVLALSVLAGCAEQASSSAPEECTPIPEQRPSQGTQGFRIWSGPTLQAFAHRGNVICVPEGWEPVGHAESGPGWATYPRKQTGVVIRSDAFDSMVEHFPNTRFPVKIVWPRKLSQERLSVFYTMFERAFANVGALYPLLPDELATPHTMLITAGVAGDTTLKEGRIYPEPGNNMSIAVRMPEQARSEELVVHAVAHLYNRHRPYWLDDQLERLPIPEGDWQELVATWSETAFISWQSWRMNRLTYLYNFHRAVQTQDVSFLFDNPLEVTAEQLAKIRTDVIVAPGSWELDYHYGHYMIGPLSMVATQGLLVQLAESGTIRATNVETLLTETNQGLHESYFAALEAVLPQQEMARIRGWMHRGETIPWGLVDKGAQHYRAQTVAQRMSGHR